MASLYRTEPVSPIPQSEFCNTALVGLTQLRPGELLTLARDAEELADRIDEPHERHPKHRLSVLDARAVSLRLSCAQLASLRELLQPGRDRAAREVIDGAVGSSTTVVH